MKIKFIRFDKEVEIPVRAHYSDTGADIKMPYGDTIMPNETKIIPLGFGVEIPNGYSARMQVRTSVAKEGIIIQGCAIDAGYKGELSMIVHNVSNKVFCYEKGQRLGYIEVSPVVYPEYVEYLGDERNDGAFGSTD